jgi:hypothetical protein
LEEKKLEDELDKKRVELANIHTGWLGLLLIMIAIFLVCLLSLAGRGPVVVIQLKEGISVFAVSYLMAQLIERVVEPFSEKKLQANVTKTDGNTRALFGDTVRIESLREKVVRIREKREPREKELEEKRLDEKLIDKYNTKRVIAFWGLTSFLGILLCYLTVGLFEIVGVSFQSLAIGGRTITGHTVDSILSGMIVGGGTKPLHDLIGYIEKEKNPKSS